MEQTCTSESHDAAKTTPDWATYDLVGRMSIDECPQPYVLELRNCPHCHSTLAVEVDQ